MKSRILFIVLTMVLLSGCKEKVGKYVYVDKHEVIHIDNECPKVYQGVTRVEIESEENIWEYNIKTKYGNETGYMERRNVCGICVGDAEYEELCKRRNKEKNKPFVQKLYYKLKREYFTGIGEDTNEFHDLLQDADFNKNLYERIKRNKEIDLSLDDYNEFKSMTYDDYSQHN